MYKEVAGIIKDNRRREVWPRKNAFLIGTRAALSLATTTT